MKDDEGWWRRMKDNDHKLLGDFDIIQTDGRTDRQTDRQTDRRTDRWTDRQTFGIVELLLRLKIKNQFQPLECNSAGGGSGSSWPGKLSGCLNVDSDGWGCGGGMEDNLSTLGGCLNVDIDGWDCGGGMEVIHGNWHGIMHGLGWSHFPVSQF